MKTPDTGYERGEFQTLIESVTDCVIAINRSFQIISANDLFIDKFGMPSEGYCFKLLKKRNEKCKNCLVEKSFRDGQKHWSQENIVLKDGRMRPILFQSTPVKDDQGRIVFALETATDITEKENLRKALRDVTGTLEKIVDERLPGLQRSEEKYRTIFERSLDAILLIDPEGAFREVNQAAVDILGFENKGKLMALGSIQKIFDNPLDHRRFMQRLSGNGFVREFETCLRDKNGRKINVLLTSNVILDPKGRITGHAFIIRDITKRKRTQEQIKKRNNQLAILNAVANTVCSSLDQAEVLNRTIDKILEIVEPDGVRIYLLDREKSWLDLVAHKGLSEEFITKPFIRKRKVNKGFPELTLLTRQTQGADNPKAFEEPYADSIAREGLQSNVYIPLLSKGEPIGVMCVSSHTHFQFSSEYFEFLTAVGSQIGLAIANATLYEQKNRAYKELKAMQEQVIQSEKLASLGKLSASIAHEISNPLAAVLTYAKLMLKLLARNRFTAERRDDISRYLNTIHAETTRCGEIVKNLLTFSRQSKMAVEAHHMEDIVDKTLSLIDHDLALKEIHLVKEFERELPLVPCDSKQIQQVLLNLLSNASEAMTHHGTLSVTVRKAERKGFLEILVSDTGRGIPEDDLKNIFEPFFTTKEEGKGVGLGLSVAYGIVTRHKGTFEVESRPGKGTAFRVFLPVEGAS